MQLKNRTLWTLTSTGATSASTTTSAKTSTGTHAPGCTATDAGSTHGTATHQASGTASTCCKKFRSFLFILQIRGYKQTWCSLKLPQTNLKYMAYFLNSRVMSNNYFTPNIIIDYHRYMKQTFLIIIWQCDSRKEQIKTTRGKSVKLEST